MDGAGVKDNMARRSRGDIRLVDRGELNALQAERENCIHMVKQFDRKGIQNTYWHKTLIRLDARIKELIEGETENG